MTYAGGPPTCSGLHVADAVGTRAAARNVSDTTRTRGTRRIQSTEHESSRNNACLRRMGNRERLGVVTPTSMATTWPRRRWARVRKTRAARISFHRQLVAEVARTSAGPPGTNQTIRLREHLSPGTLEEMLASAGAGETVDSILSTVRHPRAVCRVAIDAARRCSAPLSTRGAVGLVQRC